MAHVTITVKGMTCDGCVRSVTNALKGVEGVQDANVDLKEERAQVVYDDAKTSERVLKEAVEEAGYDVA